MKNNKITIIGSGALGTAMGKVFYKSGFENVCIYGVVDKELDELSKGFNSAYFPDSLPLPHFQTTNNLEKALENVSYLFLAVPSKVISLVFAQILPLLKKEVVIINGIKGFFPGGQLSVHQALELKTKNNPLVKGITSILGPSFAIEIAKELPTMCSLVGNNKKLLEEVQQLFKKSSFFKVYTQNDVKGAESSAIYKNIIAIGSGIVSGLGFEINTTMAFITRGLHEMLIFVKAMGGKAKTLLGLSGVGDLFLTATSSLSRNFTFGGNLVKKRESSSKANQTVEGLTSLTFVEKIRQEKNLDLPIAKFLYEVIFKSKDPQSFRKELWERPFKSE